MSVSASSQQSRRRRGSLTREKVLSAAYTLAEKKGLAALTMPDLAATLNVGVTGLYWHFQNKDDLIRAMSLPAMTHLNGLMISPAECAPDDWRSFLRTYFATLRSVYEQHPVLADIMLTRPSPHVSEAVTLAYDGVDKIVHYLTTAGFRVDDAWILFTTALHFTQSSVIAARARSRYGQSLDWSRDAARVREHGWSTLATLTEEYDIELDMSDTVSFSSGLDLIIGGAQPASPGTSADAAR